MHPLSLCLSRSLLTQLILSVQRVWVHQLLGNQNACASTRRCLVWCEAKQERDLNKFSSSSACAFFSSCFYFFFNLMSYEICAGGLFSVKLIGKFSLAVIILKLKKLLHLCEAKNANIVKSSKWCNVTMERLKIGSSNILIMGFLYHVLDRWDQIWLKNWSKLVWNFYIRNGDLNGGDEILRKRERKYKMSLFDYPKFPKKTLDVRGFV